MFRGVQIGYYEEIAAKRKAIVAANLGRMSPAALQRITGDRTEFPEPIRVQIVILPPEDVEDLRKPLPRTLKEVIGIVCNISGVSSTALFGNSQLSQYVDARFAASNLSEEFSPRCSMAMVERALKRGSGWCKRSRERHRDRLEISPFYLRLYEQCRSALLCIPPAPTGGVGVSPLSTDTPAGSPLNPMPAGTKFHNAKPEVSNGG